MASTYLTRTSGTPTSQKKGTFSFWVKRSGLGSTTRLFNNHVTSVHYGYIDFTGSDKLRVAGDDAGTISIQTNRVFRDVNSWYHIVIAIDTTQSTASDRIKIYVNGVQETSMAVTTYPPQNDNLNFFNASASNGHVIGSYYNGSAYSGGFNGSMSHVHFIDGTAYDASAFGETDATTGEWKIKTSPSVTYGNNGFFILKDGNSVTDQSGNSNNFTVGGGTLTKTEDCPSNVFATLNPLDGHLGNSTITFGNTRFNSETSSNVTYATSTLGMVSGKFYFEAKLETAADHNYIGIADVPSPSTSYYFGNQAYDYGYKSSSGEKKNNNTTSSYGNTYTTNDIVMCAIDLDNLKVYFGKNGTWQNSGDPTSGSTGTGAAFTIAAPSSTNGGQYFFCVADGTTTNNSRWQTNFGNGYFKTTAVSSAGTNASGIGIFEYDVPTGYTALSTKGLNL